MEVGKLQLDGSGGEAALRRGPDRQTDPPHQQLEARVASNHIEARLVADYHHPRRPISVGRVEPRNGSLASILSDA